MLLAAVSAFTFLVVSIFPDLYQSWRVRSLYRQAVTLLGVLAIAAGVLIGIGFLSKTSADYSRMIFLNWGLLAFAFLVLERVVLRLWLRAIRSFGVNTRNIAIVGTGSTAREMARQVGAADWAGLTFCGHFDDGIDTPTRTEAFTIRLAGSLDELVSRAKQGELDYVYIALPARAEAKIVRVIRDLADTTASVFVVPDMLLFQLTHARWTDFGGTPIISVYDSPLDGVNAYLKRAEDLVLCTVILTVVFLPMLLIAFAVKATSAGPVLFKQRRHGLNGRVVWVWKFRSMTTTDDGDSILQATKGDSRVTPLGAFLRRTSLDELPQFINVLRGDMSVVGPRPHAVAHNEDYRKLIPGYMLRHKVKPGITGLAQINGWRGETDTLDKMQRRVDCDLEYMRNWSLWLDLKIVFLTIFRGFTSKNAY
jgi:putative colanic acid biosynthesis UDP-glucose lipid carrier transferase